MKVCQSILPYQNSFYSVVLPNLARDCPLILKCLLLTKMLREYSQCQDYFSLKGIFNALI